MFCKMIIGCNPRMMDFITHGFQHCVIGVNWDSGLMESLRTRYMGHGESHLDKDLPHCNVGTSRRVFSSSSHLHKASENHYIHL